MSGTATIVPALTTLGIPSGYAGWQILQSKTPASFPALTNDPVITRQIAYFEANAPKATTAQALLSNPQLQDFALTAYGLTSDNGMTALMTKVLNSNPNSTTSFAAQLTDSRYTAIAAAFNYGGTVTPAVPATPSSAQVQVQGLGNGSTFAAFSGTFAGISISNVALTQATSIQGLASTLQTAFRRADGNRTDISVTVNGMNLVFTDAQGRGTATSFDFSSNIADTGTQPTAAAPSSLVSGTQATPASGGPAVTNPTFIQQVVQKYLEAQYQEVIGNSSNTLREAVYAQQTLPSITNWYSVMANPPLANVIQTVLGLPSSFGALNIQKQNQVLSSRMNIADFQNPAKLSKLLDQFVSMSALQAQSPSQNTGVELINNVGSSGIINLTIPNSTTPPDSYSSGSVAAMLLSGEG